MVNMKENILVTVTGAFWFLETITEQLKCDKVN